MEYRELADFIENKMRMSHIYQPVMLMALLQNKGKCHENEIAKSLLAHDISQVEYYAKITRDMVGRVLRNHKLVERDRDAKEYYLTDFDKFTKQQVVHIPDDSGHRFHVIPASDSI